jgi:hypothetical protein
MGSMKPDSVRRRFLFRLDGAKENEPFFRCRSGDEGCIAYSGTVLSIGPGWIPDLIEVDVNEDSPCFTVTLIELEATEIAARASCRKYLPEPSAAIVQNLAAYLEVIRRQCEATSDPRLAALDALAASLRNHAKVVVRSAGALRSSSDFLEVHDLLDQPGRVSIPPVATTTATRRFSFSGQRSFSREETDALRRSVRILHDVLTGHDHSGGTVHSWRNLRRRPLDAAVSAEPERLPEVHRLLSNKSASGMRLNCDDVSRELAGLWDKTSGKSMTPAHVADAVERFAPRSMEFSSQEAMRAVYDAARSLLHEIAI